MVNAEANQLHQVLVNLCVNACEAMPDGGRLILQAENIELTPDQLYHQTDALPGIYVKIRASLC
ncbi:hypothetical protein IQ273_01565 [Nodosilinea sp. LEGE 07298]|uniref:hypothetical protein n=1 Tax=Nodosilinea sp. LEGE 07298 TaxID=2777970 RepID=UPI0018816EF7|nr:hypothetical protein [Nodosilinea sp. LEGE 07298]MBE9108113.1 hypothetical protein [Nodosilinea sp. LEGE 07298]